MNLKDLSFLIAGAVLGTLAGMFIMALCVIAKRSDQSGGVSDGPADEGSQAQGKTD